MSPPRNADAPGERPGASGSVSTTAEQFTALAVARLEAASPVLTAMRCGEWSTRSTAIALLAKLIDRASRDKALAEEFSS